MHERRVKKLKAGHYVATHGRETPDPPYAHANRGYWTDGEESLRRAPSDTPHNDIMIAEDRTSPSSVPYRKSGHINRDGSSIMIDVHSNSGPKPLGPSSGPPNRAIPSRAPSALSYEHGGDTGSDIYVTSAVYKAPSDTSRYFSSQQHQQPHQQHHQQRLNMSHMSGSNVGIDSGGFDGDGIVVGHYQNHNPISRGPRSLYSVASSAKTGRSRSSRRAGAKVELMSAPNPFCPNVKGVCCLMVLLNLGLILVTLGFVIVIQFMEPLFVWILGIIFLVFGFVTLIGSMVYCVVVCRDAKTPAQLRNEDLYWTNHWQKSIGYTPHEIDYKADRYDGFSDGYSIGKASGKLSHRDHRY